MKYGIRCNPAADPPSKPEAKDNTVLIIMYYWTNGGVLSASNISYYFCSPADQDFCQKFPRQKKEAQLCLEYGWEMARRSGRKHTETWCLIHQHYTASLGLASICIAYIFSNVLHFFWGWHIRLTWTDPTKARSHSRRAADDCLGNGGTREDRVREDRLQSAIHASDRIV